MTKVQNTSTKDDEVIAAIPMACSDESAAAEFLEKQRWGEHPACPHCGDLDVYKMKSLTGERQTNYRWRCHGCKQQFTVRVGTVFEESRIPLRHWCYAFWRASTSKKGVSALEIKRQTGLSYKSSLFLLNRIRFAMQETAPEMLAGDVEVDEVFIGGAPRHYNNSRKTKARRKSIVVGMVQRGGDVRPKIVADVTGASLKAVIRENVERSSRVMTDEWSGYRGLHKEFEGGHETVRHSTHEYARGDVHTNSIEGFFGMLRRGLDGIYHSVSHEHLHRYLAEFQFRHNNRFLSDGQRTLAAIRSANHKRLTYKDCKVSI
ncbi:MAG: IS1595 family transposase [Burkholderiales bacterium]|nr:IS1595 family transposase [Burkholderiales bacterium]